ncbi:MAG TPA: hypothetical protein VFT46_04050 [Holophagaceae bacterium]|nr:hypothetical protein [Holophagaceae bacterium]
MRYYQAFSDFTAQSRSVGALMSMYGLLERDDQVRLPLAPVVVFIAFSIESYLNSLGARAIPFWDEIERLSWKSKVNVLHTTAGCDPNWGQEPLQFATEVFRLRDKLAHGKPERVLGPKLSDQAEPEKMVLGDALQPEWYKSINREWVFQAKGRFQALMVYLGGLFGLHESDHLHSSSGGILVHDEPDAQPLRRADVFESAGRSQGRRSRRK